MAIRRGWFSNRSNVSPARRLDPSRPKKRRHRKVLAQGKPRSAPAR